MVGPGGYDLKLSRGAEKHDLECSSMGHMMLPGSKFNGTRSGTKEELNFVGGEFCATTPCGIPRGVAHSDHLRPQYFNLAAGDASGWENLARRRLTVVVTSRVLTCDLPRSAWETPRAQSRRLIKHVISAQFCFLTYKLYVQFHVGC